MSEEKTDRAERDRKKKAERAEKDRAKTARKAQEKADKLEKHRVEKARVVQEKADKAEKDRVESARQSERARLFDEILNRASARSRGCCEPCNFHVITNSGEYQPCKLGHKDSGPNKEICADCTDSRYHPRKR